MLSVGIDYQFGVAVVNGGVGRNAKIVAEVGGGKHGKRHRIAKFTPQKAAATREAGAAAAHSPFARRERGSDAPYLRNCSLPLCSL